MRCKIITVVCLLASALASPAAAGRVQELREARIVFLRGNELLTAGADGSDVKVLVKDGTPKAAPRWSPDHGKIVYRTDGAAAKNPRTHANLVVISSGGRPLKSVPVLATESDGTIVGGMRFVEDSGWHSNAELYASGSVNPWVAEYRIIDAQTGSIVESYFGTEFTTCASKGLVAYAVDTRGADDAGRNRIEVNGATVYTGSSGGRLLVHNLQWSAGCERLAFTEGNETVVSLIVLRGAAVEARISLGTEMNGLPTLTRMQETFLLQRGASAALYDPSTRSLRATPEILEKANRTRVERERVLQNLGGHSADW